MTNILADGVMCGFVAQLKESLCPHDWQSVTALAAVSGGADSVALVRGLAAMRAAATGSLVVAHFNHRLRGAASDRDEAFVAALAEQLGLGFVVGRAGEGELAEAGDSLEAAAREARYRFFAEAAGNLGARYLFTAHTADDQAETVLHRILRGTGVAGLAGIPRVRRLSELTTVVRPLLGVRRTEILAYLSEVGAGHCEDASNLDVRFTRNRLRRELLPMLAEQYNPNLIESLCQLSELARETRQWVEDVASELVSSAVASVSADCVTLNLAAVRGERALMVREMFVRLWQEQAWPRQAMTYEKWHEIAAFALSNDQDGALMMPGSIQATKRGEQLVLTRLRG